MDAVFSKYYPRLRRLTLFGEADLECALYYTPQLEELTVGNGVLLPAQSSACIVSRLKKLTTPALHAVMAAPTLTDLHLCSNLSLSETFAYLGKHKAMFSNLTSLELGTACYPESSKRLLQRISWGAPRLQSLVVHYEHRSNPSFSVSDMLP